MLRSILGTVYVVIGIIVANSHQYFHHVHNIQGVISAVLAVILWPLVPNKQTNERRRPDDRRRQLTDLLTHRTDRPPDRPADPHTRYTTD